MGIKQSVIKSLSTIMVACFILNPLWANEATQVASESLNLETAVVAAINRENKVNVFDKQIEAYNEKLKVTSNYASSAYYATKYALDQVEQEKKLLGDVVFYKVKMLYDTISVLQNQIEVGVLTVELAEKGLRQVEIKHNNGVASDLELLQAQTNLEKKLAEKKQNELNLIEYKKQFQILTGLDIDDYVWLEENIVCEPLEYKGGIESLINRTVEYYLEDTEAYIAYQNEHVIEMTQYKYGIETGIPMDILTSSKADIANSTYNLQEQKKSMKESLRNAATELEKLQQTIALQEVELENEQANLEMMKIRYDKGYVSELQLKQLEQGMKQLELAKKQNIYTYQQQKIVLEKPWVRY